MWNKVIKQPSWNGLTSSNGVCSWIIRFGTIFQKNMDVYFKRRRLIKAECTKITTRRDLNCKMKRKTSKHKTSVFFSCSPLPLLPWSEYARDQFQAAQHHHLSSKNYGRVMMMIIMIIIIITITITINCQVRKQWWRDGEYLQVAFTFVLSGGSILA